MSHCAAVGCNFQWKGNKGSDISLHNFPHDKKRRKKWEDACGRVKLPKYPRLCSRHFASDAYESLTRSRLQKQLLGTDYRRRLRTDAVPTIFFHKKSNVKRPRTASENRAKKRERREMLDTLLLEHNSLQTDTANAAVEIEQSDANVTPIKEEPYNSLPEFVVESTCLQWPPSTTATTDTKPSDAAEWPAAAVDYPPRKDHTYASKAPPELLFPPSENVDIDMGEEEEEEESVEEDEEREEDEEEEELWPKRKRKNSDDDEWAPSSEEVAEMSGEDSEGSEEEEEEEVDPYPLAWCQDCAEEARARCSKQNHHLLYCCVQCGYRDLSQDPMNTELLDIQRISSPETPSAGHQEGTDDVGQSAESSCSPEDEGNNNTPTDTSDCPEDPNCITSQEIINCNTPGRNTHSNQTAVSNDVGKLSINGDSSDGTCGIREQGSADSSHQGDTGIPEETRTCGIGEQGSADSSHQGDTGIPEETRTCGIGEQGSADSNHQGDTEIPEETRTCGNGEQGSVDSSHQGDTGTGIPEETRTCVIREQGSVDGSHQGDSRTGIPEETRSSNKDSNTKSQYGFTNLLGSAANQKKQNIPIYAVYFTDVDSLQRHIKELHGHKESNGHKRELCPDCGKFLQRHKGKSSHVCDHKDKPFSCLTCGKHFASQAGLNIHHHVHNEDYMLSCRYCYKAFRFQEDKRQHEATHQREELKYCCSDCPKRFADHISRNAHRKTHWKHGRHICKVCDKVFPRSDRLQRHELVHTGLKPYYCEVCDRSFNQSGHLKSHMRVHTGERPFKCQDCGQCFNHNVSLKNHVQRKHRSAHNDGDEYREEV